MLGGAFLLLGKESVVATVALVAKLKKCVARTEGKLPLQIRELNFSKEASEAGWEKLIDCDRYGPWKKCVSRSGADPVQYVAFDVTTKSFTSLDLSQTRVSRRKLNQLFCRLLGYAIAQLDAKEKLRPKTRIKPADAVKCMSAARKIAKRDGITIKSAAFRLFAAFGWEETQFESVRRSSSRANKY